MGTDSFFASTSALFYASQSGEKGCLSPIFNKLQVRKRFSK